MVNIEVISSDVHVYHTRILLSNILRGPFPEEHPHDLTEAGTRARDLLLTVPGLQSFLVNRYKLIVTKGEAFTWDEVEPQILEVLDLVANPT
jgi:hypothetical protein